METMNKNYNSGDVIKNGIVMNKRRIHNMPPKRDGSIWKFLQYWYFQYLLNFELYIAEPWERVLMNTLVILLPVILWLACTYIVPFCWYTFLNIITLPISLVV